MRTTPRTRVAAAMTRKTPQRSLSRNTDRVITLRITLLGPATNTNTNQRGWSPGQARRRGWLRSRQGEAWAKLSKMKTNSNWGRFLNLAKMETPCERSEDEENAKSSSGSNRYQQKDCRGLAGWKKDWWWIITLRLVEQGFVFVFVIVLQATWLSKGLCLSSSGLEPSPVAVDYIVYFKSIQKYYFWIYIKAEHANQATDGSKSENLRLAEFVETKKKLWTIAGEWQSIFEQFFLPCSTSYGGKRKR